MQNSAKTRLIVIILAAAALLRIYRASLGDLSEDPYHHWLISALLASGIYADPFSGAMELWPPGYHIVAAGIMLLFGRDIIWLKLANILFSLGGIYLVYLIAGRYSWKAGILAASFLALNPFELLTSSTSYTEPMAVFFFLLAVYLLKDNEKAGSVALFCACATRYEVWLAIPFLLRSRKKKLLIAAPSIAFIAAWSIYTYAYHGFFAESIMERSREVLYFEAGTGAVQKDALLRAIELAGNFLISSLPVYIAGLYHAARNIRKGWLFAFVFLYLAAIFLLTGLGISTGSFRYFTLAIPILCIFAGKQLSGNTKAGAIVLLYLIAALPFYFSLFQSYDVLYDPMVRAGRFAGNAEARGMLSNSPVPLYYSGIPPGKLFGSAVLRNMSREEAMIFLKGHGVDYVVYVDSPAGELERVFPGIEKGGNVSGLVHAYDPNGWEEKYGAKKVYVYRVSDWLFKITGSYISSSPLIADIDGDGSNEIIAASDKLYVWKRDGTPLSGFPQKTGGLIASTPGIAYTKSGAVIFAGCDDNRLYAWWQNGSSLSGFPRITGGDVFSKPLLLQRNGGLEIFTGSDDGRVYAWYMNGSPVEGWPRETGGYVSSSPAAADLDRDGEPEIIAGSWDKKLYAWHVNGSLLPGFPLLTGDAIWAAPVISDLDGDGSPEIIAASDMLYAWDSLGKPLPGFPIRTGSYIVSTPLVRDIDGDGSPEIVVASDALYVYNRSGALLPDWHVYTGYYFWASPVAEDLDNDGKPEIIIGDWSGGVYAFEPDGSVLNGFPKHTGGRIFASAAVGDVYGDGTKKIVAGSWDKSIYLWNAEKTGAYRYNAQPKKSGKGVPAINNISFSKEYGVTFIASDISGDIERPRLYYFEDDGTWHPSPVMLSEGLYTGMIAPQKQKVVKYYITLESEKKYYRFPNEGYYELTN